jgi:hypothetical protein
MKPRARSPRPPSAPMTTQHRAEKIEARKERTALIGTFIKGFINDLHAKVSLMSSELKYTEDYCYSLLFQEGVRWYHRCTKTSAFNAFIAMKCEELKISVFQSSFPILSVVLIYCLLDDPDYIRMDAVELNQLFRAEYESLTDEEKEALITEFDAKKEENAILRRPDSRGRIQDFTHTVKIMKHMVRLNGFCTYLVF